MPALTTSDFAAFLKTKYPAKRLQWMAYQNRPFLALVPKDTGFGGENAVIPVRYGAPQGRSATFATALANKTASKQVKFTLTRVSDYALASITGETIEASEKGGADALAKALEHEIEGAMYSASNSLATGLWRNGGGSRGRISATSNPATDTITLDPIEDIVNFEVGMVLQVSDTDGTSGAARAGTVTVAAVNRDTGTVTATGNWTAGIAACIATDYIFQSGDFGAMISGVQAWVPSSAPGATAFFGVARNVDAVRLGGIRVTASGANIEEKLVNAISRASREGASTDKIFMNPTDRGNLVKFLGSKVIYDRVQSDMASIAFQSVKIEGDRGPVDVISDPFVPKGTCFGLQMDTWELKTLGPAPKIFGLDGNRILREASADAYEIRVGYYGQLGCYAPGWNWRMAV